MTAAPPGGGRRRRLKRSSHCPASCIPFLWSFIQSAADSFIYYCSMFFFASQSWGWLKASNWFWIFSSSLSGSHLYTGETFTPPLGLLFSAWSPLSLPWELPRLTYCHERRSVSGTWGTQLRYSLWGNSTGFHDPSVLFYNQEVIHFL